MEANNALPYPRRTDVCDSVSVVKSFKKAAVAFSKDLMLSVSRRQIEDIRDTVYKGEPSFIHSFIHTRS